MKIKRLIPLSCITLFCAMLLLSACSSDSSSNAAPANAIVLTDGNAAAIVEDAIAIGRFLVFLIEEGRDISGNPCISGTVIDNGSETTNPPVTTSSGTITANSCEIFPDIFINGTVSYNFTEDANGPETADITGGFTYTEDGVTDTISGFNFKETGNHISGDYSTNIFSFVSDSTSGSFTASLSQPLVGLDNASPPCPSSGIILVEGGQSTRAQLTLIGSNLVQIDVNTGNGFSEISVGSPASCANFFFEII